MENLATTNEVIEPEQLDAEVIAELEKEVEQSQEVMHKIGQFQSYSNQLDIPEIEGTRIVKCLYKITKEAGTRAHENVFVRIPSDHLSTSSIEFKLKELLPYFVSYLQEIEDGIIKEEHKKGVTQVFTEFLTIEKVINALEEKECGTRLSKDKIEKWFDAEIQDSLIILFADKMGITEQSSELDQAKLVKIVTAYKNKFGSLAGGKTFVQEDDCIAMKKVITSAEAQDTFVGSRLINRLNSMKQKEEDLLLSL